MNKLNRNYVLNIAEGGSVSPILNPEFLQVGMPFTVEFSVTRSNLSATKSAHFRIYNLAADKRAKIRHDWNDYKIQPILFNAGYGNNIPVVFNGRVTQSWSVREGVNFISEITADDAGFAFVQGRSNTAFSEGTPYTEVIRRLMQDLPGIAVGTIGNYEGKLPRGCTYCGPTANLLREITGGGFFVDDGKAHALRDGEFLAGGLATIDAAVGLLGTPRREQSFVHIEMIFEPRIIVKQKVLLLTEAGDNLSGFYEVTGITHNGIISATVAGEAVTEVTLRPLEGV